MCSIKVASNREFGLDYLDARAGVKNLNNLTLIVMQHLIGYKNIVKFVKPSLHVTRHVTMHKRQKRTDPPDVTFEF